MGQGQPRVTIWTIMVVLPYTMLHTKCQGHWSIGSGEEDFLRFLPYMGMAAMLVMWPRPFEQLFFPKGRGGCIWNLVAIGPVVSEEKSFEIVDGRTTDNGACLYYKLPRSLRLMWAKKALVGSWWYFFHNTNASWRYLIVLTVLSAVWSVDLLKWMLPYYFTVSNMIPRSGVRWSVDRRLLYCQSKWKAV